LNRLLPRESDSKETDLALLSLIYPLNVVTPDQAEMILKDVEEKLVRERGIIRYDGDQYYNRCGEAEWTMGFPWLAVIYKKMGNIVKHKFYLHKTIAAMNSEGELPELYFSNTDLHNENTPLGWSQALYLIAVN
jgi:phosphorylase kinase alpha/beta subunit